MTTYVALGPSHGGYSVNIWCRQGWRALENFNECLFLWMLTGKIQQLFSNPVFEEAWIPAPTQLLCLPWEFASISEILEERPLSEMLPVANPEGRASSHHS